MIPMSLSEGKFVSAPSRSPSLWAFRSSPHYQGPHQVFIKSVPYGISVWPTQPFGPRPPLGGIKIFQKEQPVMVIKPSLSIHIELYIINPFPNNKYWRTFFSFFYLRKDILPDFSLLGFKRKMIWIWKKKMFLGRRKKSLLIRPWFKPNLYQQRKKSA